MSEALTNHIPRGIYPRSWTEAVCLLAASRACEEGADAHHVDTALHVLFGKQVHHLASTAGDTG